MDALLPVVGERGRGIDLYQFDVFDALADGHHQQRFERQVERLIELYQVGSIPMSSITQRVKDLTAQKAALESQLNAPDEIPAKELFLAAVEDYRKGFADGDTDRKRALLSGLLERVTIDGQSIQLHWRL